MLPTRRLLTIISATIALSAATVLAGAEEPDKAVRPFDGRSLEGWHAKEPAERNRWTVGVARIDPDNPRELIVESTDDPQAAELVNATSGGVDLWTVQKFGDATIELEFMVPLRSNSGVYVMGEYEVQIYDSYGRTQIGQGDVGAIYGAAAPSVNAARPPGEWQTLRIEFRAPRFEDGRKVENAVFQRVVLNGQTVQENVEVPGVTPGGITGEEADEGPLMFQGDHGPVAYRNIRVVE